MSDCPFFATSGQRHPPHTTVSSNVVLMSLLQLLHDVDHPVTVLTAIMNIRIWSVNYANPCQPF